MKIVPTPKPPYVVCRCLLCNYITYGTKEKAEEFMRRHLSKKHNIHSTKISEYRKHYVLTYAPPQLELIVKDKKLKRIFIRALKSVTSLDST